MYMIIQDSGFIFIGSLLLDNCKFPLSEQVKMVYGKFHQGKYTGKKMDL